MNNLTILFYGYGHWKIITTHYGKEIYCITNNAREVNDAKDGKKSAIKILRREIIESNKEYKFSN
jgi:S1-C subfamily serine protease